MKAEDHSGAEYEPVFEALCGCLGDGVGTPPVGVHAPGPDAETLIQAAVLVPLLVRPDGLTVLLTRRGE